MKFILGHWELINESSHWYKSDVMLKFNNFTTVSLEFFLTFQIRCFFFTKNCWLNLQFIFQNFQQKEKGPVQSHRGLLMYLSVNLWMFKPSPFLLHLVGATALTSYRSISDEAQEPKPSWHLLMRSNCYFVSTSWRQSHGPGLLLPAVTDDMTTTKWASRPSNIIWVRKHELSTVVVHISGFLMAARFILPFPASPADFFALVVLKVLKATRSLAIYYTGGHCTKSHGNSTNRMVNKNNDWFVNLFVDVQRGGDVTCRNSGTAFISHNS